MTRRKLNGMIVIIFFSLFFSTSIAFAGTKPDSTEAKPDTNSIIVSQQDAIASIQAEREQLKAQYRIEEWAIRDAELIGQIEGIQRLSDKYIRLKKPQK